MIRVRDLFNFPDHVDKETFVLELAEGVTRAEETAKIYVVTPPKRHLTHRLAALSLSARQCLLTGNAFGVVGARAAR